MRYSLITEIFRDFSSLFFPRYCPACFGALVKGEELICTTCILEMPQTNYHLQVENPLKDRLAGRISLEYALAFFRFRKSSRVQHLLHALKYNQQPEIGIAIGKVYGERLREAGLSRTFDLILPVPLHKSRKRKRGYNQSALFAEGLSFSLGVPFSDKVLTRTVKTETQTRKTKLNRWENVSEIFQVTDVSAIRNKRILLVDDVVTTGATLEACGQTILKEGCSELSIACIAEA